MPPVVGPTTDEQPSRIRTGPGGLVRLAGKQWPLFLVLLSMVASGIIISTGHWRRGAFAFSCTVGLAGVLRLLLPTRVAGLLAVRARWLDALLLLVVAAAMVFLTLVVPPSRPR